MSGGRCQPGGEGRAQALQGLGRYDEALAELTRAANRPENGGINTTQRLGC